jgi:hypothetical protein
MGGNKMSDKEMFCVLGVLVVVVVLLLVVSGGGGLLVDVVGSVEEIKF